MGHSEGKDSNGIRVTHPLDAVGGTYDNAPHVYPDVVENEYAKLEPYINIYSSNLTTTQDTEKTQEIEQLKEKMARMERTLFRNFHNLPASVSDAEIDRLMAEEEQATEELRQKGYTAELDEQGNIRDAVTKRILGKIKSVPQNSSKEI